MAPEVIHDLYQQADALDEDYVTVQQLADKLGVTRKRVHALVREGIGPPHLQLAPHLRVFPRGGVVAWLKAKMPSGASSS